MKQNAHKVLAKRTPKVRMGVVPVRRHSVQGPAAPLEASHHHGTLLQPALKVGAANDPLEREAENTAERIVSMPAPEVAPAADDAAPAEDGAAQRASMDDQPNTDTLENAPPIPDDHQDPDVPKSEDVDTAGLVADDMKEIESGEPEDTSGELPAEETPAPPGDEPPAQPARSGDAAVVGAEGGAAPADVSARVSQPGSGRPLPASVRSFMEPRFGKDFSDVRIHDGPDDRTAARRIGARAFTHRQHIWLGPGENVESRRLMAHELTHVVQQTKRMPVSVVHREVEATEDAGEPEVRRGYIRNKAEKYARKVPGYRLVSIILGKSPITGNRVDRNATNLLGALMAMIPGGGVLFDRLVESRIIQDAFEWVSKRLASLKITWTRIKGLISDLIDYLPARPSNAVRKAKSLFAPIVRDILTFIGEVKDKILEFIIRGALKLAGPLAEKIWGIIKKAGSVISTILKDPLGFAKNLFKAVLQGFRQFGSRIFKHIKKGLLGWLFGAIQGLDIEIPDKLDFKGILSIGLQVVGLTYKNFREQLVKRLGANGERKVAYLEKSVEVVKILVKDGFVGLWQRVLQMVDNFKQTVIGGIQKFIIETLIMGGLSWLAGLSNPVGAVVKVVLAIYNIIKTFLERLDQILAVANSIFSSIGAIAAGKVKQAADFIENTIAATIPVVISFLAALVPISGITRSIRGIIDKLRAPVKKAMGRMIDFLVKKAKKLFSKIIGKLNQKRKLPSANFKIGTAQHRIYVEKKGKSIQTMIASTGRPLEEVDAATKVEAKKLKGEEAKKIGETISGEVTEAGDETDEVEKKVDLGSQNKNQNKNLKEVKDELDEAASELQTAGAAAATNAEVDHLDGFDGPLYRFKEPRSEKIEGKVGTYAELRKIVSKSENETKRSGGSFYEVDHLIEKQIPKAVLENLRKLNVKSSTRGAMKIYRTADRKGKPKGATVAERQTKSAPVFGGIGSGAYAKIGNDGPQLPAIILYRPDHVDAGKVDNSQVLRWIDEASKTEDPHKTLKEQLRVQMGTEQANVAGAYKKDADATPAIGTSINEGLKEIAGRNQAIYQFDTATAAPVPDATKKDADAVSKSSLGFSAADGQGNPDFTGIEGKYDAHGSLDKGVGKYLEGDHIVEKSFPLQAQNLTFGTDKIWQQIEGIEPKGKDGPSEKEVKARKATLRRAKVYEGGDIAGYTAKSGKALLMYRPIHRAVSAKSPAAHGPGDLLSGVSVSAAAEVYLKTGDKAEVENIRKALKPGIREKAETATRNHTNLVEGEYQSEIANVQAANAEGGAEAQAKAAQQMQTIIEKTKGSLSEARAYSTNLFS